MKPAEYPALVIAVAGNGELDKGEMYRLDQTKPENNFATILANNKEQNPCKVMAGTECVIILLLAYYFWLNTC
jgi:hypothetical protein